jgi:hypothetical protein
MKRRIIASAFAVALAASAVSGATIAKPPLNDHNCVGYFMSRSAPNGNFISGQAKASGHYVVNWLKVLRRPCNSD